MSKLPPLPEPSGWAPSLSGQNIYTAEQLHAYAAQVVEMCAKVCEDMDDASYPHSRKWPADCASAIRALKLGQPIQRNADSVHLVVGVGDGSYDATAHEESLLLDDAHRLHVRFDDLGIPRADEDDAIYSLWGRTLQFVASITDPSRSQSGATKQNQPESVSESVSESLSIPSTLSLKEDKQDSKEGANG